MSGGGSGKFRRVSTANMKETVSACDSDVDVQRVCIVAIQDYREATQNAHDTGGIVFGRQERKTSHGRDFPEVQGAQPTQKSHGQTSFYCRFALVHFSVITRFYLTRQ